MKRAQAKRDTPIQRSDRRAERNAQASLTHADAEIHVIINSMNARFMRQSVAHPAELARMDAAKLKADLGWREIKSVRFDYDAASVERTFQHYHPWPYDTDLYRMRLDTAAGPVEFHLKDESQNPLSRTAKDRFSLCIANAYELILAFQARMMERFEPVPLRISMITSGNFGTALALAFSRRGLPPPKLLVDNSLPTGPLSQLKGLRADIYGADLGRRALSREDILALTDNQQGIDLTSLYASRETAPLVQTYGQIFGELDGQLLKVESGKPRLLYVPYGSGFLFQEAIATQAALSSHGRAFRVMGAEPAGEGGPSSAANKLTKSYNPFEWFIERDTPLKSLGPHGEEGDGMTGIYSVAEPHIQRAHEWLSTQTRTSASGAAGLGLLIQHIEEGRIDPKEWEIAVVNTGQGA